MALIKLNAFTIQLTEVQALTNSLQYSTLFWVDYYSNIIILSKNILGLG